MTASFLVLAGCKAGLQFEDADGGISQPLEGEPPTECPSETFRTFAADPSSACEPWTTCEPGTFVVREGDAQNDRLCAACPSGSFTAEDNELQCTLWTTCLPGQAVVSNGTTSQDRVCAECESGTYANTVNAASCLPWQKCVPGTYIVVAATTVSDVGCAGCPSGTFSAAVDAKTCDAWSTCQLGEYVVESGGAVADRMCEPCPEGEDSFTLNSGSCTPPDECPPGTVGDGPPDCTPCEAGYFCAGSDSPAEECPAGTWDSDSDPATPCDSQTACAAGQFIDDPGGPTANRTCAECTEGRFSSAADSDACSVWQDCEAGTFVAAMGSATTDRDCKPCANGEYSADENEPNCSAWSVCLAPTQYMTQVPDATRDRLCDTCIIGTTSNDNETTCDAPAYRMDGDQVVFEAEHFQATNAFGNDDFWWVLDFEQASNGQGMVLGEDTGNNWMTEGEGPRLGYTIEITLTGTFYMHVRADAGPSWADSDSCFASVDTVFLDGMFDFPPEPYTYGWLSKPFEVDTVGIHMMGIWGREDGLLVDKIVINKNPYPPSGNGPPESQFR